MKIAQEGTRVGKVGNVTFADWQRRNGTGMDAWYLNSI